MCRLQQETLIAQTHILEVAKFVIFPTICTITGSAVPAVVSSVRLYAAALGTLVDHLSGFELQAFDELFGSVPFRHGSLKKTEALTRNTIVVSVPVDVLQGFPVIDLAGDVP